MTTTASEGRWTYADAGVDIDAQDRALVEVKRLARATFTPGVLSDIGSFGGCFALDPQDPQSTVLVASVDGVGTKLRVALEVGRLDTVGEDLVNHCVNDILVQGATPLFFLDYFATAALDPAAMVEVVRGVARGCTRNGCALLGGETAEMPGFYAPGDFDLAGCIVGKCRRDELLPRANVGPDDTLVALPSSGLHTNGYSLARKLLFEVLGLSVHDTHPRLGCTVGEELLKVHRSYLPVVSPVLEAGLVKAVAHITGGGIPDNLPRCLPAGVGAEIDGGSWTQPPVFGLLREAGNVPEEEMRRTFNLGVGMILVVGSEEVREVMSHVAPHGGWVIGRCTAGEGVRFVEG